MERVKSNRGAPRNPLSSFGLPGKGVATRRAGDIAAAAKITRAARHAGFPVIPIGEGTNCAFLEPVVPAVFLRSTDRSLKIAGTGTTASKKSKILVTAGAGLPWDALVRFAVKRGWSGAESLSGIPGTCGAAPVQNIGAYGASLADILESVEALDLKTLKPVRLSRAECGFDYRSSIFNGAERGRFFITSLHLQLREKPLNKNFLIEERNKIIQLRRQKLPDYKKTPNCGSFFKNPIISAPAAKKFLRQNPTAPHWQEQDRKTKLSAGWLIENSGLRHEHWGKIAISPQHALILINEGETKHPYLKLAVSDITTAVKQKFAIMLEPEPNLFDEEFVRGILGKQ